MNKGRLTVDGEARIAYHVLPPIADLHWTCLLWGRTLVFISAISSYNTLNPGVEDGHVDKEAKSRRKVHMYKAGGMPMAVCTREPIFGWTCPPAKRIVPPLKRWQLQAKRGASRMDPWAL